MTIRQKQIDEEDLCEFLRNDPDFFLEALYEHFSEPLMAFIRRKSFNVLDSADQADAFQETMIAVWRKIQNTDFDPERPLRMVLTIARNKAVDARRKKFRLHRFAANESDIADLMISEMKGSDLEFGWRLADEEEKRRFNEALPEIVADLPSRQQAAALALLDCYEQIQANDKYRLVADAMSSITGKSETIAAAKSALRVACERICDQVKLRGIDLGKGRD